MSRNVQRLSRLLGEEDAPGETRKAPLLPSLVDRHMAEQRARYGEPENYFGIGAISNSEHVLYEMLGGGPFGGEEAILGEEVSPGSSGKEISRSSVCAGGPRSPPAGRGGPSSPPGPRTKVYREVAVVRPAPSPSCGLHREVAVAKNSVSRGGRGGSPTDKQGSTAQPTVKLRELRKAPTRGSYEQQGPGTTYARDRHVDLATLKPMLADIPTPDLFLLLEAAGMALQTEQRSFRTVKIEGRAEEAEALTKDSSVAPEEGTVGYVG